MRIFLLFIYFFNVFSITSVHNATNNDDIANVIKEVFSKADHIRLGKMFTSSVSLDIPKYTGQWTSSQAMYIIKDFFSDYPVESFEVLRLGKNSSNNTFLAGKYISDSLIFNVYMTLKEENGKPYIYKLNIKEQ